MFKSLARSAALGAGVAAAGVVALVAGAFAFYFLLRDPLTPAGAAALTALLFLVIAGALAAAMRSGGKDEAKGSSSAPPSLLSGSPLPQKAIEFARQRPLVAGGAGVLAALYLLRNPALLTGLIGLAAGRVEGKQEARRGFF